MIREVIAGVSTSQFIAIIVFVLRVIYFYLHGRRTGQAGTTGHKLHLREPPECGHCIN